MTTHWIKYFAIC